MVPDASGNLLATIVPGLEMVFDTTALALGLSVLLMLGMFVCDQIETRLLLAVNARVNRELVGRFKGGATLKSAGGGNVPDGVTGAIEKLIERQTEMWQASMESANKQWEERTALLKQELAAGQGGSGGGGGGFQGGGGGGSQGGGMPMMPMSGDAGPIQEGVPQCPFCRGPAGRAGHPARDHAAIVRGHRPGLDELARAPQPAIQDRPDRRRIRRRLGRRRLAAVGRNRRQRGDLAAAAPGPSAGSDNMAESTRSPLLARPPLKHPPTSGLGRPLALPGEMN